MPALYLDTLKVSTIEQTGENTWAQGGLGNSKLISWDYGKEINVTLEDALCTPASLGLCWGGALSADWNNATVDINSEACFCQNPVGRIDRMEKAIYPRTSNEPNEHVISNLLPATEEDKSEINEYLGLLPKSQVVDGTRVQGTGQVLGHSYRWRLVIESGVRSVAQVPDRFFDTEGRSYPIAWNSKVSVFNGEAPAYSNFKDAIIYKINKPENTIKPEPYIIFDAWMDNHSGTGADGATISLQEYLKSFDYNASPEGTLVSSEDEDSANAAHNVKLISDNETETEAIGNCDYLAIVVDNNDVYHAYVGKDSAATSDSDVRTSTDSQVTWYIPTKNVVTSQFKGLDMWLRFSGINALIYFILTKYNQDILSIVPVKRNEDAVSKVNDGKTVLTDYDQNSSDNEKLEGRLWAYVNPRTMKPYDDDYWFHQYEPYYVKSVTIAPKGKKIKGNQITIKADQWPGMYMFVGETYIRDKETGEDQRMQIKIPLCKVKSDQTLTLEAEGDPTTFNLDLEVARPRGGAMIQLTAYEISTKMVRDNDTGCYYAIDGSSEVLSE